MMFVPGDGARLGTAARHARGREMGRAAQDHHRVTYRADGEGYLKPGYRHLFLVSADGGAPRQLTFGKFDDGGALAWTPDGATLLFSSNHGKDWERDPPDSDIYALDVADGALTADQPRRPRPRAAVSPDGRLIAYVGFDDKLRGYENAQLYVMDRDGNDAARSPPGSTAAVGAPIWAADGESIYRRTTTTMA